MASDSSVSAEVPDPLARAKAIVRRLRRYAAVVTVVLVVLGAVFRHHLNWGDVATWILAVTTLLALIAAAFAALVAYDVLQVELRRDLLAAEERKLAREDRQRAERAANAAEEQTRIQQQLRQDAAQPYVWADVRPDQEHGVLLELVVGNSGPTFATNVRVRIEPPLPSIDQLEGAKRAQEHLVEGLSSLPPGRTLRWWLGQGWNLIPKEGRAVHRFTITADGPFGAVPELSYDLDLAEFRDQEARGQGSLKGLTDAVVELTKPVKEAANKLAADQPMPGSRNRAAQ
jgi:hypothetical protein